MSPPPLHPHPDTGRGRLPVLGGGALVPRPGAPRRHSPWALARNANAPAPPYSEGAGHQPDRWGRAPCSLSRSL